MNKKLFYLPLMLFLSMSLVFGSGFSIYEQNAEATGMAGAFIAQANNPSAIFYNPAGLNTLNGFNLQLGTTIIATQFAFQGPDNIDSKMYTEAEPGLFTPVTLYATYRLNSRLSFGFGFYNMFGLASEWGSEDDPWIGAQLATETDIKTFYYNPVFAYNLMDNLSFAAGLDVVQATVTMKRNVFFTPRGVTGASTLEADAIGYGFNLGLRYQPVEQIVLGIVYRNKINLDFNDGDATFDFPATGDPVVDAEVAALFPEKTGGSSELDLPAMFGAGLAFDMTENLTLEFDYVYWGWSSYDKLIIEFDDPVAGLNEIETEKNYEDTYSLRFGLEYRVVETGLSLRAGYIWDRHAVPDDYVEPTLPEGDRHNYTVGIGYRFGSLNIDAAYHSLLQDDRQITNSVHDFNGKYTGMANLYGLSLGYAF